MGRIKTTIIRAFLILEVGSFAFFYLFGNHGIKAISALKTEISILEASIESYKKEIGHLKEEINQWEAHDWYSEKIAREDLQLAYPTEDIFIT